MTEKIIRWSFVVRDCGIGLVSCPFNGNLDRVRDLPETAPECRKRMRVSRMEPLLHILESAFKRFDLISQQAKVLRRRVVVPRNFTPDIRECELQCANVHRTLYRARRSRGR